MANIGYIINEAGIKMEEFSLLDTSHSSSMPKASQMNFAHHNPNHLIGYGVLQTADEKNRNGRIYKRADLAREIVAPRQVELLKAGQLCGESGHPIGQEAATLARQQTIDPKNVCVRFHKLWMEGNNVMGYFEGTNNAAGQTFDTDLRTGITPAFSLRALGTLQSTPQGAVVDSLKMITYDYVIYPSHKGAYTKGILNESAGMVNESGFVLNNSTDASKSYIKEFTGKDVRGLQKQQAMRESAIGYIKSNSLNYKMLQEFMDLSRIDNVDILNNRQILLTEAGHSTVVMNLEDYICQELQNYRS